MMTHFDMNISIIELSLAAFAGALLGALYFGGLWLTVRRTHTWRHPGLSLVISLFIRLAIVAICLYLVADGQWQRYLAAVPGFWAARWWWLGRINPAAKG
ncbi:MAG: N-ATPase subunit AtpR [Gammaproteobacteria bacterium]